MANSWVKRSRKGNAAPLRFASGVLRNSPLNQYRELNKRQASSMILEACLGAGGRGVEPLLTAPEAAVLPLDEPPIQRADFTTQAKIRLAKRVCVAHLCYNYLYYIINFLNANLRE